MLSQWPKMESSIAVLENQSLCGCVWVLGPQLHACSCKGSWENMFVLEGSGTLKLSSTVLSCLFLPYSRSREVTRSIAQCTFPKIIKLLYLYRLPTKSNDKISVFYFLTLIFLPNSLDVFDYIIFHIIFFRLQSVFIVLWHDLLALTTFLLYQMRKSAYLHYYLPSVLFPCKLLLYYFYITRVSHM